MPAFDCDKGPPACCGGCWGCCVDAAPKRLDCPKPPVCGGLDKGFVVAGCCACCPAGFEKRLPNPVVCGCVEVDVAAGGVGFAAPRLLNKPPPGVPAAAGCDAPEGALLDAPRLENRPGFVDVLPNKLDPDVPAAAGCAVPEGVLLAPPRLENKLGVDEVTAPNRDLGAVVPAACAPLEAG